MRKFLVLFVLALALPLSLSAEGGTTRTSETPIDITTELPATGSSGTQICAAKTSVPIDGTNLVLCCCTTRDGGSCCAEVNYCGSYVPGCYNCR